MALEHALLVSLCERAASGLELTRRFDRSIGHFWNATHQQIYRVLGRMETDGWVTGETVPQEGRPAKRVYSPTATGRRALAAWVATPTATEPLRSEMAVKIRGASYGDREQVRGEVADVVEQHRVRLAAYEAMAEADYPDPGVLDGADLDRYHVLRGGILAERTAIDWLTEYLESTGGFETGLRPSSTTETPGLRPSSTTEARGLRPSSTTEAPGPRPASTTGPPGPRPSSTTATEATAP